MQYWAVRYIHHLYVTSFALSNTLSLCLWKWNSRAKVASNDGGNVSQRFMFSGALLPLASFFFAGFINGSIQRSCTVTSIQVYVFSLGDQLHHVLLCSYKIDVHFVFTLQTKPTGNWAYANKCGARFLGVLSVGKLLSFLMNK